METLALAVTSEVSFAERLKRLQALDLRQVTIRFAHSSLNGMSSALETERKYRWFLESKLRGLHVIPAQEVRAYWREHVSGNGQYAKDCQWIFGSFLAFE